jgi:hypothetical protein
VVWFLLLGGSICGRASVLQAEAWREEHSQHFRVFYVQDASFAAAVAAWAESYYTQITLELGLRHVVQRDRVPWLWEQRCRIYLYPAREAYMQATGAPGWSGGMVRSRERVIYSFLGAPAFVDKTLPHELAHIVFREFVGFDNTRVPRWLDEGVAQYAETGKREEALEVMRQGVTDGVYLSLEQLNRLPVNHAPGAVARVFYAQAVTLVHFFLYQYGNQRFLDFCSNLRDGYSFERALSFATAGSLRSLGELEDAWRQFLFRLS